MYRYNSGTTTLLLESLDQTLSSKREKYKKYQNLLLKTDTHEYYVQLVNNLTELFDAR